MHDDAADTPRLRTDPERTSDLIPVYPSEFAFEDERIVTPLRALLPRLEFPHKAAVGIVSVAGHLEDLDFRDTDAYRNARKVDCLIVWFDSFASWKAKAPAFGRNMVGDEIAKVGLFYETSPIIKALVGGIENQLVRRVIAVGSFTRQRGEIEISAKWLAVPTDQVERWHGPQDPVSSSPLNP